MMQVLFVVVSFRGITWFRLWNYEFCRNEHWGPTYPSHKQFQYVPISQPSSGLGHRWFKRPVLTNSEGPFLEDATLATRIFVFATRPGLEKAGIGAVQGKTARLKRTCKTEGGSIGQDGQE